MASAAPPKRMVSSVFITLASPHRATVTQQQPALQAHSTPASDTQHTAVRVHPGDNIPSNRHKKEDHSQTGSYGGVDSKGWTHTGASARALPPQSQKPAEPQSRLGKLQGDDRGAAGNHDKICFILDLITNNTPLKTFYFIFYLKYIDPVRALNI